MTTNSKTRILVEGAVIAALACVLSCIKFKIMPWGGSITLLSMVPIVVYSIRRGVKWGIAASFVFSLFQFVQGISEGLFGWGITGVMLFGSIMLDYIVAYSVIGFGGMFRKKGFKGYVIGTVVACLLRFASHFFSGVIIWVSAGKLWKGFETSNTWLYSLLYNGSYMLPELILTVAAVIILLKVPATRKIILDKNH